MVADLIKEDPVHPPIRITDMTHSKGRSAIWNTGTAFTHRYPYLSCKPSPDCVPSMLARNTSRNTSTDGATHRAITHTTQKDKKNINRGPSALCCLPSPSKDLKTFLT